MRLYRLTALLLGLFSATAVSAAQVVLYDGTSLPTAQGWQQTSDTSGGTVVTQVQADGTTRFTTTTSSGSPTGATNLYYYSTGASNYIASIRLNVIASSYNGLDAGLMFTSPNNGTGSLPFLNTASRTNMLTITNGQVLWGDLGTSAVVTANNFHEYEIRYQNGKLDVYVDATYADIRSGVATPLLSRTPAAFTTPGVIIFGDQSNDPNVDSDYYVDSVNFQNLDVASPTLAVTSSGTSMYGASITFTATLSNASNPTGTVTFCADDATCTAPSWTCTVPVSATSAACSTSILSVGNHSITANYSGDSLNDPASTASAFSNTVAPATLVITPTPGQSKAYGDADPLLAYSAIGLVTGSTLSGAIARAAGENVGSYAYSLGTLVVSDPANYNITLSADTFAITPASLTITANTASKVYGQTVLLTYTSIGLVNAESIGAVTLTSAGAVASASVSGSPYAIVPSAASGSFDPSNYAISYVNGALNVIPAPLTITANDASMTYGGILPIFSASYAGFVNGDMPQDLTQLPNFSTSATSNSPVATYPITPAGAVDANYSISYANGTLTIVSASPTLSLTPPASLTVGGTGTFTATSTAINSTQSIVISSTTPTICSVNGAGARGATRQSDTVTGLIAGTCIIAVNQAADANYTAQSASASITVLALAAPTSPAPLLSLRMLILLGLILAVAGVFYARVSKRM